MTPPAVHTVPARRSATIAPEERPGAALVSLVLYLLAGAALAATARLTPVAHRHAAVLTALAVLVAGAAPVAYRIQRDERSPAWLLHLLQSFALVMVGIVVALSGGADSPYWFYIFFPALFCSYFYSRRVAAVYLGACVVVHALPFLYGQGADHPLFVTEFASAAPAYVALGLAISAGKRVITAVRGRAETLAREQGALRRVATAVVDGLEAQAIYAMVAAEVAGLLSCEAAGILRREDDTVVVVGAFGQGGGSPYRVGSVWPVARTSEAYRVMETGVAARVDQHPPEATMARAGYASQVQAPVTVGGAVWGMLVVASSQAGAFDAQDEQTLLEFGALLATAISSAEERTRLAEQAMTDSLTGLANARALHQRLAVEIARATRRDAPLAVAVIDVDHFKDVNDNGGHETGDEMLVRVAAALSSFARTEDLLGRLGGDEFGWILPDTTREQALAAVERARQKIAAAPADPYRITISAGICDTASATDDPSQLIHLADTALYWSKAHGRNQTWIYDPAVVQELTAVERAHRLARAQAVEGLRGLARSIDERDDRHRGHCERVAVLARKLAQAAGFTPEDAARVGEAARLHEIGALALSPAGDGPPFAAADLDRLRTQAEIGARMAQGVLDAEQVSWMAGQFETRDRVPGERPRGDEVIAVADAWDTLTAVHRVAAPAALVAIERLADDRFGVAMLTVLVDLYRAGGLNAGGSSGEPVGDSV